MFKYEYNRDKDEFEIIEVHAEYKVATAKNIKKAKDAIKSLERKGFEGVTPKFMFMHA